VVSPIALYPDPLLGQILTGRDLLTRNSGGVPVGPINTTTCPRAAASGHRCGSSALATERAGAAAVSQVLNMMASGMPWTEELGAAFLESPDQVMDAVQRMRQQSYNYGYLRSNRRSWCTAVHRQSKSSRSIRVCVVP